MSEKTDITERLRNGAGFIVDDVGGVVVNLKLLDEAADEIDSLRFEVSILTDERNAAIAETHHLTQERDAARAESSCAHDQVKQLQNEVRL
jgi:uncharacterized coiled-coil DUF342 family protein